MRNGAWRRNFTSEVFAMMINIIYTHDRGNIIIKVVQKEHLKQAKDWVVD